MKPQFVIHSPNFLGVGCEEDEERIDKHLNERSCPKIKSFYVHGKLMNELDFDICSFVSGKIEDVEIQDATIFDLNDISYDAKIILTHDKNDNIYGYLISLKEDVKSMINNMVNNIKKYGCV